MYYGARHYDQTAGMFVSPRPAAPRLVPDPTNLYDYHRYGYGRLNPLKYNDPTGHAAFCPTSGCMSGLFLRGSGMNGPGGYSGGGGGGGGGGIHSVVGLAVRGATVGAVANSAANATAQVIKQYDTAKSLAENLQAIAIDPTEVGIAAGYGALSGAAAPLPGYWGMVISGISGGAQQVTTDVVVNQQPLAEAVNINTAIATGLGVAGAVIQGAMPTTLKYPTSDGGAFNVLTGKEAVAYAPNFASITTPQLVAKQAAYISSARFVSGYFISSLPLNVSPSPQFADPIQGPR